MMRGAACGGGGRWRHSGTQALAGPRAACLAGLAGPQAPGARQGGLWVRSRGHIVGLQGERRREVRGAWLAARRGEDG